MNQPFWTFLHGLELLESIVPPVLLLLVNVNY